MIKHLCTWFILLFLTNWCTAQAPSQGNRVVDSLERMVHIARSDSDRADAHFALSQHWIHQGDSAKAHEQVFLGRRSAGRDPWLIAVSYAYEAIVLDYSGNYPKAESLYLLADSLLSPFHKKQAYFYRAICMHDYAVLKQQNGDERTFTDIILNRVVPLVKLVDDTAMLANSYHDVGVAFKNTMQFEKARLYFRTAIDIFKSAKQSDANSLITAYISATGNEVQAGFNATAKEKKAESFAKARSLLDTARNLLAASNDSSLYVDFYHAEGAYYNEIKQCDSALISIEKGLVLARRLDKRYEEQRLLKAEYHAHYCRKEYRQGLQILQYLSEQPEMMAIAGNRQEIFLSFAEAYTGLKNMDKAYTWMKRYADISDSLHISQLKNDVHALEIKYGNEENKKKIADLRIENEKAALAAKNNRLINWLLGSAALFLLIVAVFVWIINRKNKKISEQKDQHHQQQLKEIEQQQQIQYGQALLQGEERERRRVAGDLHDGLGGMLAGVKMNLAGMTTTPIASGEELNKVLSQLDHSISELRRIARNMMPEALIKFGLETALRDLCESSQAGAVRISFQAFGVDPSIPQDKQVAIYRIVQELLTNAIRHGQASEILVQCSQNKDIFFVTIEDNGKGFDPNVNDKPKGIGLSNVQHRVDYLKGKIDIASAVNEGTTINIELNVAA